MTHFSVWLLWNFFGPYEPINALEALLGDFGDFDFGPETEFSTLTEMINFLNCEGEKFLENFSRVFPRCYHQDASIELSFV